MPEVGLCAANAFALKVCGFWASVAATSAASIMTSSFLWGNGQQCFKTRLDGDSIRGHGAQQDLWMPAGGAPVQRLRQQKKAAARIGWRESAAGGGSGALGGWGSS